MGEVLGKCFLCKVDVPRENRRVVEVRYEDGSTKRYLSCWRCWIHVMRPVWMTLVIGGELLEARPAAFLPDDDVGPGGEVTH